MKHRSVPIYKRLRLLIEDPEKHFFVFSNEHHVDTRVERLAGESPNDRNDRAIRVAASFYETHLSQSGVEVVLVTSDAACRVIAKEQSLRAMGIHEYVTKCLGGAPELLDMLALQEASDGEDADDDDDAANDDDDGEAKNGDDVGDRGITRRDGGAAQDRGGAKGAEGGAGGKRKMAAKATPSSAAGPEGAQKSKKAKAEGDRDVSAAKTPAGVAADEDDAVPSEHLSELELRGGIMRKAFHQGTFRAEEANPLLEGTVFCPSLSGQVLLCGRRGINRAMDGDVVAVQLLPKEQWRSRIATVVNANAEVEGAGAAREAETMPTGRVVGILRRNWRGYAGSLGAAVEVHGGAAARPGQGSGARAFLFVPVDRRVPAIRIRTRQAEHLSGMRFVVHVDAWSRRSRHPTGHFVRTLGPLNAKETETEVICVETQIPTKPFTAQVLACLPDTNWVVTARDLAERRDLRDFNIVSVDPPGCTDIDDAVHYRALPGGEGAFEVGVHIADVSHFIAAGTALDLEAEARGNTVYLVDRRIDMVPSLLGTNLCSLQGGKERLAFSVTWTFNKDGEVFAFVEQHQRWISISSYACIHHDGLFYYYYYYYHVFFFFDLEGQ